MTVVTDVIARLRADTSDFTRGFAGATAQVKALDATAARTSARVSASTSTMASASIALQSATARNATAFRSSFGSIATTSALVAASAGGNNNNLADSLARVAAGGAAAGKGQDVAGAAAGKASVGMRGLGTTATIAAGTMKMAGAIGGVALAALGAAMTGVTLKGIQAAASFEQMELAFHSAFGAMGRSKNEANAFIDSMKDFAAKTPFEFTGLISATRQLMTLGYAPEVVRDQMLPAIGDIASALGVGEDAINRVIVQLQQMASIERPVTQDLRAISNAFPGFNAKAALAAELFEGDMKKMESAIMDGGVTGKQAMEALIRQMAKFPGAAGMMAKQATTMSGTLSTFKDVINMALVDGFKPAIPAITAAMNQLVPAVEKLVVGFGNAMGPVVATVIESVVPAFIQLADSLSPIIAELVTGLAPILSALLPVVGALAEGVGGLLVAALGALTPILQTLAPVAQMFIDTLAASLIPIVEALQPHLAALGEAFAQILMALIPLLPAISQMIVAFIPATPAFTELATATATLITQLMPLIQMFASLVTFIAPAITRAQQMITPIKLLSTEMRFLSRIIDTAYKGIERAVSRAAYVWGASVSLMSSVWQGLSKALNPVVGAISSAMSKVEKVQRDVTSWMVRTWDKTGGRVVSAVSDAFGNVVSTIAGLVDRAVKAAFRFATGIVNGLINGISRAMPSFVKDFVGWTQSAIATAGNNGAASAATAGAAVGDAFGTNVVNSAVTQMNKLSGKVNDVFGGYGPGGNLGPKPVIKTTTPIGANFGLDNAPSLGGVPGGDTSGGPSGGTAGKAAEEEAKKWFKAVSGFLAAMKNLATTGGTNVKKFVDVFRRAKGIWPMLGLDMKNGLAQFKKIFAAEFKDGILTKAEVNKIAKATKEQADKIAARAKIIRNAMEGFARFIELTLRAFDAETMAQTAAIRESFASGQVMANVAARGGPDFGAIFEIGDSDLANALEGSITELRNGLNSALGGLFGSGGPLDMSMAAITSRLNTAIKAIEKARNDALKAAGSAREAEYKAAQEERAALTPAEQAIRDLNEQASAENLMRNKMEAEAALAAAMKIRNTKKRNEAVQEAQRRLNDALRAIQMDALQKQAEEERKAKEEEYDERITAADEKYNAAVEEADRLYQLATEAAQREYDLQVEQNRRMEEEQVRNNEFQREEERRYLEESLRKLEANLAQKHTNWKKWQKDFKALMGDEKFAKAMANAGVNLGSSFSDGLAKSKKRIETALEEIADLVRKYLKVKSPTDMGPMSDLDKWWRNFGDTLIDGFDERRFARKLGSAVSKVPTRLGSDFKIMPDGDFASIMPYPNGKAVGGGTTIQITVQGSVIQERDLAETVREELIKIGRRDGTIFGEIV